MKRRGGIPLVLVIVTLATFGRIVSHEFTGWDDAMTIFENPRIVSPSFANVVYYWTNSEGGLYVPVTYTVWSRRGGVAGGRRQRARDAEPVGISRDQRRVARAERAGGLPDPATADRSRYRGDVRRPLFAVHPMQVETVAWTSGAKDLLGGLFSLVCIWQYIKFALAKSGMLFALEVAARAERLPTRQTARQEPRPPERKRADIAALHLRCNLARACDAE